MTPRRMLRAVALGPAALLGMLLSAFASCAENESEPPPEGDAATFVPESSVAADVGSSDADSGLDAGCDGSDAGCTTELLDCAKVAWCLAPTGVGAADMLTAVWGTSASDVWAVGSGGTILHYDGNAWMPTPSGSQNTFFAVGGSGPKDVWAVSSTGVVLHSTGFANGEAKWSNVPTPLDPSWQTTLRAVWASSPDDVRIGGVPFDLRINGSYKGRADQFVRSALADGGTSWRQLPGSYAVLSLWGSSAADVWMTADNSATVPYERGLTFHGTPSDAGPDASVITDPLVWRPVDSQSTQRLEALWGLAADDVWTVGDQGTIRHLQAGDERWQKIVSPTTETLRGVWGSGPNDVWIVGDGATILHYDGNVVEASSAQLPLGPKPNFRGVWGSGPNDVWIVGDGATLHFTGSKTNGAGAQ